jgi:hypothetical protein
MNAHNLMADAIPRIAVRAKMVVGNELRLGIETYSESRGPFDHSATDSDVKGYLVIVDLSSDKSIAERAKLYGPLWSVPNPRSSISLDAGTNFTQQDVDAMQITPTCMFDGDGTLVRFKWDASRQVAVRESLTVGKDSGSWKTEGDLKTIKNSLGAMSEDKAISASARYMLIYEKGEATLYDVFTGESKDDNWLTTSFADARSIKNLNNIRIFLTDDLNYLVVSPWGTTGDGQGGVLKTFDLNGKTYNRADSVLIYRRPQANAQLIVRKPGEKEYQQEAPHGIFSIGGELYFFMNDQHALRLYRPDGTKEFHVDANGNAPWETAAFPQIQFSRKDDEIILYSGNDTTAEIGPNEHVKVLMWKYLTNDLTQNDIPLINLFESRSGHYQAKTAIPIN